MMLTIVLMVVDVKITVSGFVSAFIIITTQFCRDLLTGLHVGTLAASFLMSLILSCYIIQWWEVIYLFWHLSVMCF
jgi:hypothetical protein